MLQIAAAIEGFAFVNYGNNRGRDHWSDTGDGHDIGTVSLRAADFLDLVRDLFDPPVEPQPVIVKADEDVTHARRDLVASLIQDRLEEDLQGSQPRTDSDPLLDQEGADLLIVAMRRETNRARTLCRACKSS